MTSPYRPNKGNHQHFTVPVLDQSVSISAGFVPALGLCPGAFVLVPRKDRKKYCKLTNSNSSKLPLFLKNIIFLWENFNIFSQNYSISNIEKLNKSF
jgi:hypothetical protein